MNIRDFDEAYQFLEARGFKNTQGEKITTTSSSKSTMMVSPTGFPINITEHIKEHDQYF